MRNKAKFNFVYKLIILRVVTSFASVLLILFNQLPAERVMMVEKVMNEMTVVVLKFSKENKEEKKK